MCSMKVTGNVSARRAKRSSSNRSLKKSRSANNPKKTKLSLGLGCAAAALTGIAGGTCLAVKTDRDVAKNLPKLADALGVKIGCPGAEAAREAAEAAESRN